MLYPGSPKVGVKGDDQKAHATGAKKLTQEREFFLAPYPITVSIQFKTIRPIGNFLLP